MGHELSGCLVASNEVGHDEADQPICMRLLLVLEIEAIMHLSDSNRSFMRVVLQNQLLEIQESSLVVHSLPQLHLCPPSVRRVSLLTVVALKILNEEFDLE